MAGSYWRHSGEKTLGTFAVGAHCTAGVSEGRDLGQQRETAGDRGLRRMGVCGDGW
jgi:hypothetical protein